MIMHSAKMLALTLAVTAALLVGGCTATRDMSMYNPVNQQCYDRATMPYTSVVDSHNHFRPFGGNAIPFTLMNDYFNRLGILFVNIYGIGQMLPVDSGCVYYGACPTMPVVPTIKNDFSNAANYLEFGPKGVEMTLSMSFPDLTRPEWIVAQIHLLDKEYPGMFKWMGEVNLVKQALFQSGQLATPIDVIPQWREFMAILRDRHIPMAIHSDLGSDESPTKYAYLMDEVLRLYPNNQIVWVHMGLSKELAHMDPVQHIALMSDYLDKNPNLMLDISWRVLYDSYFSIPATRDLYVKFLNHYSSRILPGTDFVASRQKDFATYKTEVEINGDINQYLDDQAFINIALGQNYFNLLGLDYQAPPICQ